MKPYIICHMVSSADGRIDCSMVDEISGDEYYSTLNQLNCPSHLEGRVTAEHYYAEEEPFAASTHPPSGKPSANVAEKSEGYAMFVDTTGKLAWGSNNISGLPLLCIVSEQATEEYLKRLKEQNISWIAVGKNRIDLAKAMEIAAEQFGIKRLSLLGGGKINGAFLEANLIDEISLLIAPGIDGRTGQPSSFDGVGNSSFHPHKLHLISVEKVGDGTIWARYKAK